MYAGYDSRDKTLFHAWTSPHCSTVVTEISPLNTNLLEVILGEFLWVPLNVDEHYLPNNARVMR